MAQQYRLSDLRQWADNYNKGDVNAIAFSIRRTGFNGALRVWNGEVRAGNHSLLALRQIQAEGAKPTIDKAWPPVHVSTADDGEWLIDGIDISHLSDDESVAFAIADNNLARKATADPFKLLSYLNRLASNTALFQVTGFDESAMRSLSELAQERINLTGAGVGASTASASDQDVSTDRADELQAKWQVQRGDLWAIGDHRLLCGDSRDPDDVNRLIDQPLTGVFTSPPYAEQRRSEYGGVPADEYVTWWDEIQSTVGQHICPDGSFFVNIKPHVEDGARSLYVADLVATMVRRWHWLLIDEFVWQRNSPPGSWPNRFKNGFEPVYHFARRAEIKFRPRNVAAEGDGTNLSSSNRSTGKRFNTTHDFDWHKSLPSNLIAEKANASGHGHPAAFPVGLPSFFIKAYSDPGDIWYDPFMGSGTTMVAAHQQQRVSLGMEMKPEFCAVILQRMVDEAGLTPVKVKANE